MTKETSPADIFFKDSGLTLDTTVKIVTEGLKGASYGEFYQEIVEHEGFSKDKGAYTSISVGNSSAGFGFRVGQKARVAYDYSDIFNEASLREAVSKVREKLIDEPTAEPKPFGRLTQELYSSQNPIASMTVQEKIAKLDEIEAYAMAQDAGQNAKISNVNLNYNAESLAVHIITADGQSLVDHRPTASMQINVTIKDEATGNVETGMALTGGRMDSTEIFNEAVYKKAVSEALHQAKELLKAEDAPAGTMNVVMAPGWSAVILHEAIGHGLEADFNRKGTSVYSGRIGQKIATDEVTVIERGDLAGERGSFPFDDEGTPPQNNVLIEKGVLKKYINDRQNAELMGVPLTGNGRRQDFTHAPMPRMTNTYFANGTHDPADIIKAAGSGLYVQDMSGGQVDTTSGKFNMNATLSYIIEDGKICWDRPVKGATLVGKGLDVIQSIEMVGNDLKIEKSRGMCGKGGQQVPVGAGQPTVFVSNMTVGGSRK